MPSERARRLAEFVFQNIRSNQWLYWPPGPMAGQVFDKERAAKELDEWLTKEDTKKE
jgi:hypothetical protein